MIVHLNTFCRNSGLPLRGLAGFALALALFGLAASEAQAGFVLPEELASPSARAANLAGKIGSDAADDVSPDQDGEPRKADPSQVDQPASPISGASGAGTSATSGGPTLAVVLSAGVSSGSLEPNGACLERANAALPTPPTFDFLRPPCRLA